MGVGPWKGDAGQAAADVMGSTGSCLLADRDEPVEGEPAWSHDDELYRTGITGNLRTG